MNKKTIRIAGWALGLSMAVAGIGLAVGTSAKEVGATAVSGTFEKYSGDITAGDYLISYGTNFMRNTISSNRFANGSVAGFTAGDDSVTNPDDSIVWTIASSGEYWTLYNAAVEKYAGAGAKNTGALLDSITDFAKWTVTGSSTYDFENLGRSGAANPGNKWLRNNGSYGFAAYADSTGGALTLYKKAEATSYKVTYHANGATTGSVPTDATAYALAGTDTCTVLGNTGSLAKTHFTWSGWNTKADGTGTSYVADATFTVTDNITLYAKWVSSEIWYNGEDDSATIAIGETVDLMEYFTGATGTVTYTSSDTTAAIVNSSGVVTGVNGGSATITISDDGTDTNLSFDVTVAKDVIATQWVASQTDTLTRALTGVSGTNYTPWSGKSSASDAVYAGNSAGGNDSIQLRSSGSVEGVVTTTSGGKAKKVTVSWQASTQSGRTLNVYGKNTAYSAASDLYGANAGTLIGTIVKGTSAELEIDDDYEYIGLRSNDGAMYLSSIEILWSGGALAKKTNQPVLSDVLTEADGFIDANMGFGTIAISDDTKGSACRTGFDDIKTAFENLSANAQLVIATSESAYKYENGNLVSYSDVNNRLYEWATANGYEYNKATGEFGSGSPAKTIPSLTDGYNSTFLIVGAVIGTCAVASGLAFGLTRKRKEEDR